jgi:hypothetical protein
VEQVLMRAVTLIDDAKLLFAGWAKEIKDKNNKATKRQVLNKVMGKWAPVKDNENQGLDTHIAGKTDQCLALHYNSSALPVKTFGNDFFVKVNKGWITASLTGANIDPL